MELPPTFDIGMLKAALRERSSTKKAEQSHRYFKAGPGEYAEGDRFLGITVPDVRAVSRLIDKNSEPYDLLPLLQSELHEERLLALIGLCRIFPKAPEHAKEQIYQLYLTNTRFINNWDLVDTSAEYIVGAWLEHRDRGILFDLARSPMLWERRIAVMSTFHFIKRGECGTTVRIAEMLLGDPHDLIHKATGWMLCEMGGRGMLEQEKAFLDRHAAIMPRTMLRYAIEKFPQAEREKYLGMGSPRRRA